MVRDMVKLISSIGRRRVERLIKAKLTVKNRKVFIGSWSNRIKRNREIYSLKTSMLN